MFCNSISGRPYTIGIGATIKRRETDTRTKGNGEAFSSRIIEAINEINEISNAISSRIDTPSTRNDELSKESKIITGRIETSSTSNNDLSNESKKISARSVTNSPNEMASVTTQSPIGMFTFMYQ